MNVWRVRSAWSCEYVVASRADVAARIYHKYLNSKQGGARRIEAAKKHVESVEFVGDTIN